MKQAHRRKEWVPLFPTPTQARPTLKLSFVADASTPVAGRKGPAIEIPCCGAHFNDEEGCTNSAMGLRDSFEAGHCPRVRRGRRGHLGSGTTAQITALACHLDRILALFLAAALSISSCWVSIPVPSGLAKLGPPRPALGQPPGNDSNPVAAARHSCSRPSLSRMGSPVRELSPRSFRRRARFETLTGRAAWGPAPCRSR